MPALILFCVDRWDPLRVFYYIVLLLFYRYIGVLHCLLLLYSYIVVLQSLYFVVIFYNLIRFEVFCRADINA